jgi:hypothetical protein
MPKWGLSLLAVALLTTPLAAQSGYTPYTTPTGIVTVAPNQWQVIPRSAGVIFLSSDETAGIWLELFPQTRPAPDNCLSLVVPTYDAVLGVTQITPGEDPNIASVTYGTGDRGIIVCERYADGQIVLGYAFVSTVDTYDTNFNVFSTVYLATSVDVLQAQAAINSGLLAQAPTPQPTAPPTSTAPPMTPTPRPTIASNDPFALLGGVVPPPPDTILNNPFAGR